MTVYLLQYNNYYNRLLKYENTFLDYSDYVVSTLPYTSFKPNDYVNTEMVFSLLNGQNNSTEGDYVIVLNDDNEIVSRWFVVESARIAASQHRLSLHRDVVADYINVIKDSPMFIEKATLNSGSPFIYNKEQMDFNQIKTSQTPLYDGSNTSWIVMYLSNKYYDDMESSYKEEQVNISIDSNAITRTKFEIEQQYKTSQTNTFVSGRARTILTKGGSSASGNNHFEFFSDGGYRSYGTQSLLSWNCTAINTAGVSSRFTNFDFSAMFDFAPDAISLNGSLCKQGTDVYRINVVQEEYTETSVQNPSTSLGLAIAPALTNFQGSFTVYYTGYRQIVTFELVNPQITAGFNFWKNNRMCKDAPYRILYAKNELLTLDNGQDTPIQVPMQQLITTLATKLGQYVYDVQILPYCPDEDVRNGNFPYNRDLGGTRVNKFIVNFAHSTEAYYLLYVAEASSFKLFIPHEIEAPSTALELKVSNECDLYRLCSPNGSGAFDFSVAKNRGVNGFNVECTYKPINPYINVCPQFGGLYGTDFKDYRGLICQGDFSLPLINDQWVTYEQNNKNYQNIFDREIDSLELTQKMQRIQESVGIGVGALTGGVSGGTAGKIIGGGTAIGGPIGALVGGAVGGALSLAGGVADFAINERLRTEALDYKRDMFNFSLQNIQARPNTLAKTGCITIDNEYVPYIEYYTCTEEEKEALRNKIKYNGMTVGCVGKMSDYMSEGSEDWNYIKGKIIRIEGLYDDFHLLNTISDELNKGVFIK